MWWNSGPTSPCISTFFQKSNKDLFRKLYSVYFLLIILFFTAHRRHLPHAPFTKYYLMTDVVRHLIHSLISIQSALKVPGIRHHIKKQSPLSLLCSAQKHIPRVNHFLSVQYRVSSPVRHYLRAFLLLLPWRSKTKTYSIKFHISHSTNTCCTSCCSSYFQSAADESSSFKIQLQLRRIDSP